MKEHNPYEFQMECIIRRLKSMAEAYRGKKGYHDGTMERTYSDLAEMIQDDLELARKCEEDFNKVNF